jgi:hypothetical protein
MLHLDRFPAKDRAKTNDANIYESNLVMMPFSLSSPPGEKKRAIILLEFG